MTDDVRTKPTAARRLRRALAGALLAAAAAVDVDALPAVSEERTRRLASSVEDVTLVQGVIIERLEALEQALIDFAEWAGCEVERRDIE